MRLMELLIVTTPGFTVHLFTVKEGRWCPGMSTVELILPEEEMGELLRQVLVYEDGLTCDCKLTDDEITTLLSNGSTERVVSVGWGRLVMMDVEV